MPTQTIAPTKSNLLKEKENLALAIEGYELLEVMAGLGMVLDLSHMNERSTLQALERYEGPIIASHANVRKLLKRPDDERHFTDQTIRGLVERGGIIGVIPFNRFLRPGWHPTDEIGRAHV